MFMKFIFLLWTLWIFSKADIFEANQSEDIEFFLESDPAEYRALLFYNPEQDDDSTFQRISQVSSIFDNPNFEDFEGESWIKDIRSGAQMMRIDALNPSLKAVVEEFEVKNTPKIIVFDIYDIIVEEVINRQTYQKLKDQMNPNAKEISFSGSPAPVPKEKEIKNIKPESTTLEKHVESSNSNSTPKENSLSWNCPPIPKCPPRDTCTPSPWIPSGPSPSSVQSDCNSALEKAEKASEEAKKALEDLKKEFEEYK